MSSVKLEIQGLDELRQALRNLPKDLTNEASVIVQAHAEEAKRQIEAGYPIRTTGLHPTDRRKSKWFPPGTLKHSISIDRTYSAFTTRSIVKSRAKHAHLFEYGTGARKQGNGKVVGRMPVGPQAELMIPKVQRIRRRMVAALVELVRKAGFVVEM